MTYITCTEDPFIFRKVANELEELRFHDNTSRNDIHSDGAPFPRSCRKLLRSIPGNSKCVDCENRNPDWASVTYGVLLCTKCSGKHRSYGVSTSRVRSITMDCWSHSQVLAMLEGGNEQLKNFFNRHDMDEKSKVFNQRYQTKAARFYRENMEHHVAKIEKTGEWMGRAASRNNTKKTTKKAKDIRPIAIPVQ
eukprot:CAMPEP_0197187482 /NCGR_PEP_ID=MMETSP1423-20130617/15931_1 /TAXON_ID=476441 /ORGANISM="Pseudo-nitzschia heimii, Strain UNC1101" /LENGTH=192 /DNA_ID=CAMNT_0042639057 /DNA_START=45 /DNA_END=623 /DNA_ORIENTATION=+